MEQWRVIDKHRTISLFPLLCTSGTLEKMVNFAGEVQELIDCGLECGLKGDAEDCLNCSCSSKPRKHHGVLVIGVLCRQGGFINHC